VISHEDQRESAGEGNGRGEGFGEEVDHGDGEGAEDQRDDPEVPFGFGEWIKLVGENKEERGMKIGWILFIKFYLVFEVIS
jgi:hypothetical protein